MGNGMNIMSAPVFEPPDVPCGMRGEKRPVDLVFLARQTGGDRALEEEVLSLFSKQAAALGEELRSQATDASRKQSAHTLKGAARAIGAFELAECASRIENNPSKAGPVTELLREVETVRDYIASLLR
jgi:HPt (histidine-containing phosphotransfer) domain-containing protein